mgnify:CR=1 FL=1
MGIQINGTTDTISAVDGSLDINQNATFGNNVTIGGTLTYSDVTNIDSVGLVTAKNGLRIHAGGIDLTSGISTFSDNIQIADKIIHKDDTNTALRFPSADTFAVETAGSERLRIASTGRVGINTNNPGSNLTVWANDSVTDTDVFQVRSKTGALNIQVSDSDASNPEWAIRTYSSEPIVFKQATVERMRIGSSGDVGIGTNNPQYALDISDGANSGIRIGVATHAYRIRTNVSTTNDYGFYIEDEEGTDLYNVRGPHSTTDPNIHKFFTGSTERLRIQSTGKVIIGTGTRNAETSTGALLLDRDITAESDAGDPNNYHLVIRSQTNSNTSKLGIGFVNTSDDTKLGAAILHHRTAGASVGDLAFYTSPSDGTINERLRIDKDGRVAIGTDGYGNVAPLAPLHVSSYSPTTAVTDHNTLRAASQLVLQTSNNINDSRSGLMFSGALHSTDGCSAGIIANHENVAENSEQTSLSFYTSHSEALGEALHLHSTSQYARIVDILGLPAHLRLNSIRNTSDWDLGDAIGKLDFYVGHDTSNNLPYNAGFIHCLNENDNANEPSGALVFGTTTANLSGGAVERMRISKEGYVTKPNTPYFHVQASPSITNTPYDNGLKSFGNIRSNNGSHYDNSTGVFTAPVAGFYFFSAGLWSANGDQNNGDTYALLYRRNSSGGDAIQFAGANHHDQWGQLVLAAGYYCAEGDKIYVFYNGSTQGSTPRNYFSGCLIG